jgi:hypothetical protein
LGHFSQKSDFSPGRKVRFWKSCQQKINRGSFSRIRLLMQTFVYHLFYASSLLSPLARSITVSNSISILEHLLQSLRWADGQKFARSLLSYLLQETSYERQDSSLIIVMMRLDCFLSQQTIIVTPSAKARR